jgi:tetratricopeptide (TPR) repeat protein
MASVVYEAIADVYNVRDKHRQAFQFYEKALVGVSEVRASDLKIKMYSTGYLASATDLVISEQDVSGSDRIRKLLNIYNYEFDEDDIESSRPLLNTLIEATEISIKDGEPSLDYLIFIEHLAKFRALETSDPETQFKVYEEAFKRLGLDLYETPNSDVPHELLLKYRELTYWYEGNFHAAIDVAEELLRRDSELFGQDSRWLIDNLWRLSIYYWATDQKDAFKSTVNRALNIQLSTLDNGMCPPLFPIYADETISVFSDDELRTYMSRFTQALSQLGGKYAGLEEKFGCQKHVREKAILNIRLLNDDIGNAEDTFQLAQLLRLTQYTFSSIDSTN